MRIFKGNSGVCVAVVVAAQVAWAGVAAAQVSFDWLTVGNPGNPADTLVMNKGPAATFTTGYGSVGYTYRMSKDHVTNAQYVEFLNKVDPAGTNALKLYDARMSTNSLGLAYTGGINLNPGAAAGSKYSLKANQANYPATWITWIAAARFVNWLSNGQGAGGTEAGVYTMPALTSRDIPTRAPGATIFLPSEDEYYKAAYYDPTKNGTGGYWQYGLRSDADPIREPPPGGATSANYAAKPTFDASLDYLTNVGAYTAATSYYGMSDADGSVYTWTEGTRSINTNIFPVYRGGSWYMEAEFTGAAFRNLYSFANAASYHWYGLRVASLPPATSGFAWAVNAGGDWETPGNWGGAVPNAVGAAATFGPVITAGRTVTLTAGKTVGELTFDSVHAYTLQGAALTLDNGAAGATIEVLQGQHVLSLAVVADGDLSVSAGGGGLVAAQGLQVGGGLTLESGTLTLGGVTRTAALVVEAGATLESATGSVVIDYTGTSPIGELIGLLLAGQIVPAGDAGGLPTTLAIAEAADLGLTEFVGVAVDDTTVVAKFTYVGDANLDGQVDALDYERVDLAIGNGGVFGTAQGDLNYDGSVDALDYEQIDLNIGNGVGSPLAGVLIPEPTGMVALAVAGMTLRRRR
jgi:formylglycine-generating enzyme required for sulfatase activity